MSTYIVREPVIPDAFDVRSHHYTRSAATLRAWGGTQGSERMSRTHALCHGLRGISSATAPSSIQGLTGKISVVTRAQRLPEVRFAFVYQAAEATRHGVVRRAATRRLWDSDSDSVTC